MFVIEKLLQVLKEKLSNNGFPQELLFSPEGRRHTPSLHGTPYSVLQPTIGKVTCYKTTNVPDRRRCLVKSVKMCFTQWFNM